MTRRIVRLACFTTITFAALSPGASAQQPSAPRTIEVVARRFAFEPAEIQVTQGETVRLVVRSADGLHGFAIERFNVAREIPAGQPVAIEFTATEPGRFPIMCSVYCGEGHNDMKGALVVQSLAGGSAQAVEADPDLDLSVVQPDFTIITLPTTLRVPRFKSAFRVTHRFGRPLGAGDFGDLVEDLFGLDSGAQIGLEYRFGLMRGLQVGIHRTSNKTIEFFGQYSVLQQRGASPIDLSVVASSAGTNNYRDIYSPAVGAAVSRTLGSVAALYVEPIWVGNSNPAADSLPVDNDTFMVGLAARLRVRPTVYLIGEVVPRVSGFDPGVSHGSFGVEKRAGGHTFQLNFSNSFGTTLAQIARGGFTNDEWYLGFNISRKFF
jgi:cytochrome c oxidase subunit 2